MKIHSYILIITAFDQGCKDQGYNESDFNDQFA